MDILETIKGFLTQPVQSFQKARGTTLGEAIKYFLILLLINAILTVIVELVMASAILSAINQAMGQMGMGELFLIGTVGVVVGAIILVIISSSWSSSSRAGCTFSFTCWVEGRGTPRR